MKRKNILIIMLLLVSGLLTMQSCKQEDGVFEVKQAFTQPVATSPVVNADGTLFFTGSTVDLTWTSENTGGDAVAWDVYFGTGKSPALLQSAYNKQTITVDVIDGQTYYWRVEILDSRGVKTSSETYSFTAVNGTNPKMIIALTTTTDVLSSIGVDLAPKDVVDMRLLIVDPSDNSIVDFANTSKSADALYENFKNLPDGDYIIAVDLLATLDFGDLNAPVTLNLTLDFTQLGIINEKMEFASVMTNETPCSVFRTNLAKVTKVGAVYTITREVSYVTPPVVTWFGDDGGYTSEVTTSQNCTGQIMTGLVFGWMSDFWGEVIVSGGTCVYTDNGATLDIANQVYCQTTYKGALQTPYHIQGTGVIDNSGPYTLMTIEYTLIQGTFDLGQWMFDYGYATKPTFTAVLTLDPAGLPKKSQGHKTLNLNDKPVLK